jgi:Ca-activated chloride channel family protein
MFAKAICFAVVQWLVLLQPEDWPVCGEPLPIAHCNEGCCYAQQTLSEQNPVATIRKRVDEVSVIFTVTDNRGRFVNNLKFEDIQVTDDKKPPLAIRSFQKETDLPLRVALLIDASSSVRNRFNFEKDSAIEFLSQVLRQHSDQAFVLGFDTTAEITQDFTDSTEELAEGVHALRPGGGTAMYEAIYYACRDRLLRAGDEFGTVRKAIILISDGEDNESRVTADDAIAMAQRAGVIIYAISSNIGEVNRNSDTYAMRTNMSGMKNRGNQNLERVAEATGGRAFLAFAPGHVDKAFAKIRDELHSQYELSYKPSDLQPDGRFRTIEIGVPKNKKLKVRARKGYFAPKD